MPVATFNLRKGRSKESKRKMADAVQAAIVANLGVPDEDRYQFFREYEGDDYIHTPGYLGLSYSSQLLVLEVTFIQGRPDDTKKALLRDINARLVATGEISTDDVFIVLHEVARANISFGRGLAQRAE
jgi:phenylpyruvate tautomerase PptA (4-oxalocrotonate tautomerase family)